MPTPSKLRSGFGTRVKNTLARLRGTTRKVKHLDAVIPPHRYSVMNSEQKDKYMKMNVPDVYILKANYSTLKDRITMAEHGIWYPLEEWKYRDMDTYETDEKLKNEALEMLKEEETRRFMATIRGNTRGGGKTKKNRRN